MSGPKAGATSDAWSTGLILAGRGEWRGGLGAYTEVVIGREDREVAVFGTGRDVGAYGLFGGQQSPRGRIVLEYPDEQVEEAPALAKIKRVAPGTVLRKWNTEGGFGPPEERDRRLVERDVREG